MLKLLLLIAVRSLFLLSKPVLVASSIPPLLLVAPVGFLIFLFQDADRPTSKRYRKGFIRRQDELS